MEKMKISVAEGDGIGKEIMDAVLSIFDAAQVPLDYDKIGMGKSIYEAGHGSGMTPEAKESVEKNGVLFKGPMETPKGKGIKSINVTARKVWNTYANRRHFRSINGVETVFSKAGIPIDITIVRENIEDTYGGIEHFLTHDVALCRRFITRPGCEQVIRYSFELARKEGFTKVTCAHKANIMKITDGLFLETFQKIALEYPEIEISDIIVDDLAMKLVRYPQQFQIIIMTNLQGDIISDLCAGLVGGLGFAPSTNIGDNISIFEAVHGTAPDIAGKNIANPTSLLLSGIMMLRHLSMNEYADKIENALLYTLEQGVHTGDFGDKNIPTSDTTQFANAIIKNLGKNPVVKPQRKASNEVNKFHLPEKPKELIVRYSPKPVESVVGIDLFVEHTSQPQTLADTIQSFLPEGLTISTITNRGTQVWPSGSIFTECVNQFCVRIERNEKYQGELTRKYLMNLASKIAENTEVSSTEVLLQIDGKKMFSLAQGQ